MSMSDSQARKEQEMKRKIIKTRIDMIEVDMEPMGFCIRNVIMGDIIAKIDQEIARQASNWNNLKSRLMERLDIKVKEHNDVFGGYDGYVYEIIYYNDGYIVADIYGVREETDEEVESRLRRTKKAKMNKDKKKLADIEKKKKLFEKLKKELDL